MSEEIQDRLTRVKLRRHTIVDPLHPAFQLFFSIQRRIICGGTNGCNLFGNLCQYIGDLLLCAIKYFFQLNILLKEAGVLILNGMSNIMIQILFSPNT